MVSCVGIGCGAGTEAGFATGFLSESKGVRFVVASLIMGFPVPVGVDGLDPELSSDASSSFVFFAGGPSVVGRLFSSGGINRFIARWLRVERGGRMGDIERRC